MQRRFLLITTLGLAWGAGAPAQPDDADADGPHVSVSLAQLLAALSQRFPLRYPLQGLLNLEVQTPRLQLLAQQDRLAAEMDVQAAGPALERAHQGTLAVDFGLRFEPGDRTVRATRIRLLRLQFPTLQPGVQALLNRYAPALAEQALLEVVLHQLQPKDLAMADLLDMQPGAIRVTNTGLRIALVPKARS